MSTYLIADAIEKLARNFKEATSEKNQIEKEKLAFEKEKFEFEKEKEECKHEEKCEHEWRYEGQLGNRHHYRCIKCDTLKAVPLENLYTQNCCHNWTTEVRKSDYIDEQGNVYCVVHQHCSECGMTDVRIQQLKT